MQMLIIRLQRVGRKNDPSFRVVVVDSKYGPQSGKWLELLGSYNARQKTTTLNAERIKHWISKGAKLSDTMHNMLISQKVIEGKKINVLSRKSPIVAEDSATMKDAEPSASSTGEEAKEGKEGEAPPEAQTEAKTEEEAPKTEEAPTAPAEAK